MKKILILNANPKATSFCQQLSDTYEQAAKTDNNVTRFNLAEMAFNPSLEQGYDEVLPLESSLVQFQEMLSWAEHIVIISPIWWGGLPAKFKGLIERAFLPGFAFKFEGDNPEPTPLLTNKTASIIFTMDAPDSYAKEQAQPVLEQLDKFTLQFCGIQTTGVNLFGSVILADENLRQDWLQTTQKLGAQGL